MLIVYLGKATLLLAWQVHVACGYHIRQHKSKSFQSHKRNKHPLILQVLSPMIGQVEQFLSTFPNSPGSFFVYSRHQVFSLESLMQVLARIFFSGLWGQEFFSFSVSVNRHIVKVLDLWCQAWTTSEFHFSFLSPFLASAPLPQLQLLNKGTWSMLSVPCDFHYLDTGKYTHVASAYCLIVVFWILDIQYNHFCGLNSCVSVKGVGGSLCR